MGIPLYILSVVLGIQDIQYLEGPGPAPRQATLPFPALYSKPPGQKKGPADAVLRLFHWIQPRKILKMCLFWLLVELDMVNMIGYPLLVIHG